MIKRLLFLIGFAFYNMVYSIYYTISRPLFGNDMFGPWVIIYIIGAEYLPSLLSFLIGSLGDFYGRRKFLLLAFLGAIPLSLIFQSTDWKAVTLLVCFYSLFSGIVSVIGLSSVIERRDSVGVRYSYVGMATGLGWGIGSTVAWYVFYKVNRIFFGISLATIYLLGVSLIALGYEGKDKSSSKWVFEGIEHIIKSASWLVPILLLSSIGIAIGNSVNSLNLDKKLSSLFSGETSSRLLYGLFYGGFPVMLGLPIRILAGRLVDKKNERKLLAAAFTAYLLLYLFLPYAHPIIFILLWLVPIYPFYDTSIYALLSRSTKSYESTATGLLASVYSLAGITLLLMNMYLPISNLLVYSALILMMLGPAILLLLSSSKH